VGEPGPLRKKGGSLDPCAAGSATYNPT